MSLEPAGEPIHTRCLAIALFAGREEGEAPHVRFRADILDLRKGGLMELAGRVTMAGIIHKMELTGRFAAETGALERIEWAQSHVMHEPNRVSRGECCRDPMGRLAGLVGTRFGGDFAGALKGCFGGPLGCTHVLTLLQELNAFVASHLALQSIEGQRAATRRVGERIGARSLFFDALTGEGAGAGAGTAALRVRLADLHYTPDASDASDATGAEGTSGAGDGREVVALHAEVRVAAEVELAGWQLRSVDARERLRPGPSCGDVPWRSRTGDVEALAGRSLFGGVSRFCLERFAGREADARLLSALMSLAPGMTQVGAAVSDQLTPSSSARPLGGGLSGPGPCYMLRAEGPLMASIRGERPDEG